MLINKNVKVTQAQYVGYNLLILLITKSRLDFTLEILINITNPLIIKNKSTPVAQWRSNGNTLRKKKGRKIRPFVLGIRD